MVKAMTDQEIKEKLARARLAALKYFEEAGK
jgi:hypothetical protein